MAAPITRDDLARLLTAKDAAQAAFSAAAGACREAANRGASPAERVDLDLRQHAALRASCAADRAYNDAMVAYGAAQVDAA